VLSRFLRICLLKPGGYGQVRGAYPRRVAVVQAAVGVGNSWDGIGTRVWEVTVKVYGVAVTMPQEQSQAPHPLIERT
jgi:hypothetical protein